jgi:predicted nucleic acid-binding protein
VVAVDTNIVIRLLTRDDPGQASRAMALFESEEIWVSKTVFLETEWVLRSVYGLSGDRTVAVLRGLAGLANVRVEDSIAVNRALEWAASGLELADALHLASRGESDQFVSLDEKFVKRAKRAGVSRVALLRGTR